MIHAYKNEKRWTKWYYLQINCVHVTREWNHTKNRIEKSLRWKHVVPLSAFRTFPSSSNNKKRKKSFRLMFARICLGIDPVFGHNTVYFSIPRSKLSALAQNTCLEFNSAASSSSSQKKKSPSVAFGIRRNISSLFSIPLVTLLHWYSNCRFKGYNSEHIGKKK